jgi:RNA 2',3'-cyclic 3'-phosphodiesterase
VTPRPGRGASVASDARVRLFCALQLPEEAVDEIAVWQRAHLPGGVRVVPPENLHITLVFLGARPEGDVAAVAAELRAASADAEPPTFRVSRYRETPRVGMLELDEDDGRGRSLATALERRLERLGVARPERRGWRPHVTVARFRERPGLAPPLPNIRSIHVVRSALYRSVLGAGGARYDALESEALGGR